MKLKQKDFKLRSAFICNLCYILCVFIVCNIAFVAMDAHLPLNRGNKHNSKLHVLP